MQLITVSKYTPLHSLQQYYLWHLFSICKTLFLALIKKQKSQFSSNVRKLFFYKFRCWNVIIYLKRCPVSNKCIIQEKAVPTKSNPQNLLKKKKKCNLTFHYTKTLQFLYSFIVVIANFPLKCFPGLGTNYLEGCWIRLQTTLWYLQAHASL